MIDKNRIEEIKKIVTNPPPERLAKVEYQSHFLQILGTLTVCGFLFYKGYWYIIFAFIFSVGVSYSQGVTAYRKYKAILEIVGEKYDPELDKSPTRKMDYIIKQIFGFWAKLISLALSGTILYYIIGIESWAARIVFPFLLVFFYLMIYFIVFFRVANFFYKKTERRKK